MISINLKTGDIETPNEVIVGIDLGTTNSLVAYIKEGKPFAIKDKQGKNTLVPSIVHFTPDEKTIVGDAAKEKLINDPAHTIYSVKRLMGKSYKDIDDTAQYFGYKIIDDNTDSLVKIRVKDKFYTPIELSAQILTNLKERAEEELNQVVSKAVITVPAYFNDAQRQATRDAGKLAGLDVLRIVNEPTAASLAYGIDKLSEEASTIAVYDLGGGTFDISILQIQDGIFEVLSTNGDTFLGGDDFDHAILNFFIEKNNIDKNFLKENKNVAQALRLEAEKAKKALSSQANYEANVADYNCNIDKNTFDALVAPLIEKTIQCCKNALADAQLTIADINHVVMVGGSTRVPLVKNTVSRFFQKEVFDDLNPDEVVALGAAIQADILAGNQKDLLLIDITPLSLGIETVGGLMDVIIPRNSKIPNRAGRQYTTSVDGQKNLKIAVFQGERDLVAHNRQLGEFILRDIPPMPVGLPKIDIQFVLNADGILKVKAKELRSNVEQAIEIKSTYGISEEDMARMLIDSMHNAQSDLKVRALLEARNEANNILLSADKFLKQNEQILTATEIIETQRLVAILKATSEADDKDAINKAMADLNDYTAPLAHRAMDFNIGEAIKGKMIG
jgi:molecular chaperone HscA